jgi:hypothetical protein
MDTQSPVKKPREDGCSLLGLKFCCESLNLQNWWELVDRVKEREINALTI